MAKQQNSYIQMMYNQYGEEWVQSVKPEDIQRSCRRIVKDMVKGTINYEQLGRFFFDPKFMENLIIGVSNELEINTLNYNSCSFYYMHFPQTPNLGTHIQHLEKVCNIYNTIFDRLQFTKAYGNIGFLYDISVVE